jgi:Flp pilus assembly protein TadD
LARLTRLDEAVTALEPATTGPHASPRLFELLAAIHETKGKRADAERVLGQGRAKFPAAPELAAPKKFE